MNVKENVAFPLTLLGMNKLDAFSRAVQILKDVEMDRWAEYTPSELSSGQQQRVALARALIHNPEIIVADEPTGNLDYESGQEMMHLLSDMNQKRKKTIIMVTHDLEYIKYAQKVVKMFDGNIVKIFDEKNKEELFSNLDFKKNEKAGNNKNEKAISKN